MIVNNDKQVHNEVKVMGPCDLPALPVLDPKHAQIPIRYNEANAGKQILCALKYNLLPAHVQQPGNILQNPFDNQTIADAGMRQIKSGSENSQNR